MDDRSSQEALRMLFYKSSHRSTVLERREHGTNDHDNQVEDEGFGADRDYVLDEIARAVRAEADYAAPGAAQPPRPSKDRLSTFECELLAAWSEP
jgi:hypothetical protein